MSGLKKILSMPESEFNELLGSLDIPIPGDETPAKLNGSSEMTATLNPPPDFKTVNTDLIEINCGFWPNGDFGWYIIPTHKKKNYGNYLRHTFVAIAQTLNKYIPPSTHVDVYAPDPEWEIKQISVIARQAKQAWNIEESTLEGKATQDLLKIVDEACRI